MLKTTKMIVLGMVLLLSALSAKENATSLEIQYLLAYVKKTECTYIRNGSGYTGEEAFEHIQKKYNYFKDEIITAEDFIRLSASKSTMSGNAYTIRCKSQNEIKSATWLQKALDKYRKQ